MGDRRLTSAAFAVNYGLELEHCDSHLDKILPVAKAL
jgi:hypothetical protein